MCFLSAKLILHIEQDKRKMKLHRLIDKANKDCFPGRVQELNKAETALSDCGASEIPNTLHLC